MASRSRIILAAVAWAVGLLAYILALRIAWHQSISSGDLVGVIQLSAIAWALTYPFLYLPLLLRLGRAVPQSLRFCLLPLATLPLGFIAVALIWLVFGIPAGVFGYGWSSLSPSFFTSPEASLFYWFFGASGVVVGVGLACFQPSKAI